MFAAVTGNLTGILGVICDSSETSERERMSEYWGIRRTSLKVSPRPMSNTFLSVAEIKL